MNITECNSDRLCEDIHYINFDKDDNFENWGGWIFVAYRDEELLYGLYVPTIPEFY